MSFHQDLQNFTRDFHEASLEVEYMKKTPVLNLILEQENLKFNGGKYYYFEVDTDTTEDDVQDYGVNDQLTHGRIDTTKRVMFTRKNFQKGVTMDFEEELQNAYDNEDGTKLHDLAYHIVKKTNEAGRLHLRKLIYGAGSDSGLQVQGLNSALIPDTTYGGLARSQANHTNDWWQPAANTYSTTTYATETPISIDWLQRIMLPLLDLNADDGVVIVGNTLFLALKSEAQARSMPVKDDPNGKFKYGIEEIMIDSMRIIRDPFLSANYNTAMGLTSGQAGALERRLYILNMPDWKLLVHPKKNFLMTGFFDQKQIANGADFVLARLVFSGNLICTHPNRSLYLSNVVA